jgi:hypothetical protein
MAGVEERFSSYWEVADVRAGAKVKRLDLCYQQRVPCSAELFPYIARSLNARKVVQHQLMLCPVEVHLTGVTLHQSRLEHARWYDKGMESGDERFLDVVRHEEQLRGGKAGYHLDVGGARPVFRVEEARERMNARYTGWGTGESYDLGRLLVEHGIPGAGALALVKNPELELLFKKSLSNGSFYRMKNLAMDARRQQVPFDLRLPVDAWAEPMVF